ncbi:MAG TPA: glycoside hydrolase family 3 protein [Chitinophagaceae bacterium]|nr:glycoside hydrolase family 3 protein [Chitinophagaceae bacterium]
MRSVFFLVVFVISSLQVFSQIDSLEIKVGQMIMVGMPGTSVNDNSSILKEIKKGHIGGILLYEYNLNPIQTKANLSKLTSSLQEAAPISLLISIDQEGGQVNRLKTKYGFKPMPSAKSIGDKNRDEYTDSVGTIIASALMNCGINLNYAPVLDLHNPVCPVLGKRQRCYSSNPDRVAHHAALTIEAHHNQGVKTVVKHFPGHGNSLADSHLGMADVTKVWKKIELKPYQLLIGEGVVDAVMTAHIVNRKLDSTSLPATLSKQIVTGILRNELGFNGVVISDDMQMHAISSYYGFEESIKKCINAGVDILMFSNNIKGATNYEPANIHATILRLVKSGEISIDRINESYQRIMSMKRTR